MRGGGVPADHLFPGPAGCDGAVHHHAGGRSGRACWCCCRMAIPTAIGRGGRAALGAPGSIRIPSRPICSPWWPATWWRCATGSPPRSGREVELGDLCAAPATRGAAGMRCESLIASMRWDERGVWVRIRSGCVQHRRRVGFQHGGDGEQGAERLQHQIRAGAAGDGDGWRLCRHRDGDRPRVFPQLDGQPHHLPRLVPAVAEGRADGVPRPAVQRRPGQCRGEAAVGRARAARRRSSPRMPARWPTPSAPTATSPSTTSTPPRSTRRAPRWCA